MPKLILQYEDRVLKEYAIGGVATIGRMPDNTVVIDNPAVSSRHARIVREGDGFVLEDLKSTNGTFVNNAPVTRHALKSGDVVLVGKHRLVYEEAPGDEAVVAEASEPTMEEIGGTMFLDTKRQKELLAQAEAQHAGAELPTRPIPAVKKASVAAPTSVGVLHVLAGRADRSEYALRAQTSLIGKSDTALVRLKGWFKPKAAVAIARKGDLYTATLLGGKASINDRPLTGRQDLADGDVLQVSGLTLEFRMKE